MEIGISKHSSAEIQKLLAEKDKKTLWKNDSESILGPFDAKMLSGQGLKLFEGENGQAEAEQEVSAISAIMLETRNNLFPRLLRVWTHIRQHSGHSGAILLTLPKGKPLSEILKDKNENKFWLEKYESEIKKEIYTDRISAEDFWADLENRELVLISLKNIKKSCLPGQHL